MRELRQLAVAAVVMVVATMPASVQAQQVGATLTVSIHDSAGKRITNAVARIPALNRGAAFERDSIATFDSLPPEQVRVYVRALGYHARDTTIALAAGANIRWNAILEEYPLFLGDDSANRAAEQANTAAGRTDSVALGMLKPDTSSVFTYRSFGQRLFFQLMRQAGAHNTVVVSPASAGLALAMVYAGARGTTARDMEHALGSRPLTAPVFASRNRALLDRLAGRTDVQLEVSNALWVDDDLALDPGYRRSVADAYRATVAQLDLPTGRARNAINDWAKTVSHGKIPVIIPENLPDSMVLFVGNAVYFKGKWLDQFNKTNTRERPFHVSSGVVVPMQGMERTGGYAYRQLWGYEMLRIPYRTGKTAMYVLLPTEGQDLASLQKALTEHWPPSLTSADFQRVHLVLPRFHVESSVDLMAPLDSLGMGIALRCGAADFSGIAKHPMCIGRANQSIYVDVDEEGTEAVAITGFGLVSTGEVAPREFIVDRPFLFIIRDELTGVDLFVGRVTKP